MITLKMTQEKAWQGFKKGEWSKETNLRDFIQRNYTPYNGDSDFLEGPTKDTKAIWDRCMKLIKEERKKGILDLDTKTPSTITSHEPGYIIKEKESIVGLQTDKPLKRAIKPYGGIRMVEKAAKAYGYEVDPETSKIFYNYRKTHNDGVFSAYGSQTRQLRSLGIVTGLPDNYGRGRIIGDYRRIALYGMDRLIAEKKQEFEGLPVQNDEDNIRTKEEISEQIKAMGELKEMAKTYGFDISVPAKNAKEAIQWTYFGYLGSVKEQDGAAMSFGRVDAFFDIYIERDLKSGLIDEKTAQQYIDDFVIKCRIVRHLRPPEYNELFAGDPTWITCVLGGTGEDGRHIVTKTSYRMLQTLYNIGPAPEPNITILWNNEMPESYKKFASEVSIKTSSIQYENDMLMKPYYGDDYGIACCVSGMRLGKDMQFFGARCNLAKLLLMVINNGRDELKGEQVASVGRNFGDGPLKYEEVWPEYLKLLDWMAEQYVNTMNVIHYMHDKYSYEKLQMGLHDTEVHRYMAFGVAGLSVVADSLSAIKYAKVTPVRNKDGITTDFKINGEFPMFGNDDDRVDKIASDVVTEFTKALKRYKTYRNAEHTLSILTITSNVVYGKKTGTTPDGRKAGEPFAPGANPMHGRDSHGATASLNSMAKLPYKYSKDGISNTFSIVPQTLGKTDEERISNLVALLDGYFQQNGHHINVNCLNRETLVDAMKHPENYPQLTIRVSGYAVNFVRLTPEQQKEVIARTFHESM